MSAVQTLRGKLDYLVLRTERGEAEIFADAVEEGITGMYRKQVAEAYLTGEVDRPRAIEELGEDAVEDLDYARKTVEHDVKWGVIGGCAVATFRDRSFSRTQVFEWPIPNSG